MAEEKSDLGKLIERAVGAGLIERTDDPVNVMLSARTDLVGPATDAATDDLEAFYERSALDPFWATLGHAIQAYARLEQALCVLFRDTTGMTDEFAGIIFYKITSARTRDDILEKLAKRKYGAAHSSFWHSLIKLLSKVSEQRNWIVHWRAGIHPEAKEIRLTVPRLQRLDEIGPNESLGAPDLTEFIAKCEFIQRQIFRFRVLQDERQAKCFDPELLTAWREICRKEIVYPPPSRTPTPPTLATPASPPPPSPA